MQLPKGYLKGAYDLIRAKGGVCISDEVSTMYTCVLCIFSVMTSVFSARLIRFVLILSV